MEVVGSMLCRNDLETRPTRLFGAAQDAGLPRQSRSLGLLLPRPRTHNRR